MKLLEWKIIRNKGNNSMFYYFSAKKHSIGRNRIDYTGI